MLLKRVSALILALGLTFVTLLSPAAAAAPIEPRLAQVLASTAPTTRVMAIANFDSRVTSAATLGAQVRHLGAGTVALKHLSSMGVLGTPTQIMQVGGLRGVQGLYANK